MKQPLIRRNFVKQGIAFAAGALLATPLAKAHETGIDAATGPTKKEKPDNETLSTIQNLHTTHGNFLDKEIPAMEIEAIRAACIRAANSSNMQTYSVVIIKDQKLMRDICGYQGSYMMLFNVDYNRLTTSAQSLGLPYYPGNMTGFMTAGINASLVAQTAAIAAQSLGIDTLLTNGIHRGNMERHWQLLGLPEKLCMPLIALVLGYADKKAAYKTGRLEGKAIFHEDRYQLPTEEEISQINAEYDDPARHLGTNPDWKKGGHEHYLNWLFKEWLASDSKPLESETPLFSQLKKRGFVDLI
jgi:nitroreductase